MEYVTLGDYQTAVGFLLASTPERSSRFYRDALCTIAMAVRMSPLQTAGFILKFKIAVGPAQVLVATSLSIKIYTKTVCTKLL